MGKGWKERKEGVKGRSKRNEEMSVRKGERMEGVKGKSGRKEEISVRKGERMEEE